MEKSNIAETLDLCEYKVSPDEMIGMIRLAKKIKYNGVMFNVKIFNSRDQFSEYFERMELYGRTSYCGLTVFIHFYEPGENSENWSTTNL